ncbi:hypothetical protein IU479_09685 [Nocardia abscessus]|uniref:hypothetical protein n=1 Tax=Nocardia TaxID=1817 RepID=UPI0018931328|nr:MULTISPECIES: hypothetical protein [Nocardia]MBF6218379.1 hypothetical protein [Nocardia abscessus]MDE1669923.1 hypothetical protein [Nocardia gipuzkoensis]
MTVRRSWIQDYCEHSNAPTDEQHAQGLLKLSTCTPPCPRKMSAERYLRERSAGKDSTGGQSTGT